MKFEINAEGRVVGLSNSELGAVLLDDELWHPFRYFDNGDMDISDEAFCKPSSAAKVARLLYT